MAHSPSALNLSPRSVHWKEPQHISSPASVEHAREHGYPRKNIYSDNLLSRLEEDPSTQLPMAIFETDSPWDRKNILTLDGGGVRGYSSLLILQALMKEIGRVELLQNPEARSSAYSPFVDCSTEEDYFDSSTDSNLHGDSLEKRPPAYRPCHYFDYIGGSSTGGLIALMLGRLRMSVDDALRSYKQLSDSIFGLSSLRLRMSRMGFKNEALTKQYEDVIKALPSIFPSPNEQGVEFQSDSTRCRTIICSMQSGQDKRLKAPFLFRSYDKSLEIWQVARATSAAPFYFKPIALEDELYYDAATFFNNPTRYVLEEVRREAHGRPDAVDVLLSVGVSSFGDSKGIARRGSNNWKPKRNVPRDPIHKSLELDSERELLDYHRLNIEDDLRIGRLDERIPKGSVGKALKQITDASTEYLKMQTVQEQIRRISKRLVDIRLQRAHTLQWERFATGVIYRCPIGGCPKSSSRFENRGYLMDHLRDTHDKPSPDIVNNQEIRALLDQGRTNSG